MTDRITATAGVVPGIASQGGAANPYAVTPTAVSSPTMPTSLGPGQNHDDATAVDAMNALTKVLMEFNASASAAAGDMTKDVEPDATTVMKQLDVHAPTGQGIRGAKAYAASYESSLNTRLNRGEKIFQGSLQGMSKQQANALDFGEFVGRANQGLQDAVGAITAVDPARNPDGYKAALHAGIDGITNKDGTGSLDRIHDRQVSTWDEMQSISDQIGNEKDPAKVAQLARKYEVLQAQWEILKKEEEKQRLIEELMWQMLLGAPNISTINKLKEMGLGHLVEQLLRKMVESARAHGGVTPQMIAVLKEAGFGGIVAQDEADLNLQKDHEHNAKLGIATTMEERFQQKLQRDSQTDAQRSTAAKVAAPTGSQVAAVTTAAADDARQRLLRSLGFYANPEATARALTNGTSPTAAAQAGAGGGAALIAPVTGPAAGGTGGPSLAS